MDISNFFFFFKEHKPRDPKQMSKKNSNSNEGYIKRQKPKNKTKEK